LLCIVRHRSLRRADHSSRGVYRLWRVVVCDQETLWTRSPRWAAEPEKIIINMFIVSEIYYAGLRRPTVIYWSASRWCSKTKIKSACLYVNAFAPQGCCGFLLIM
jgi:hypothetical protein